MGSLKTTIITEYSKEIEDIFKKLKIESPSLNLIRDWEIGCSAQIRRSFPGSPKVEINLKVSAL